MDSPPETIGGLRVVQWVTLGPRAPGNSENVSRLAICHDENEDAFFLFHCDDLWQVVWDSWFQTIEEAALEANSQYPGLRSVWRAA
jgi:hypothetical protein